MRSSLANSFSLCWKAARMEISSRLLLMKLTMIIQVGLFCASKSIDHLQWLLLSFHLSRPWTSTYLLGCSCLHTYLVNFLSGSLSNRALICKQSSSKCLRWSKDIWSCSPSCLLTSCGTMISFSNASKQSCLQEILFYFGYTELLIQRDMRITSQSS